MTEQAEGSTYRDPEKLPKRHDQAIFVRPASAGVAGIDDFLVGVAAGLTELINVLIEEISKGRDPGSIRRKE